MKTEENQDLLRRRSEFDYSPEQYLRSRFGFDWSSLPDRYAVLWGCDYQLVGCPGCEVFRAETSAPQIRRYGIRMILFQRPTQDDIKHHKFTSNQLLLKVEVYTTFRKDHRTVIRAENFYFHKGDRLPAALADFIVEEDETHHKEWTWKRLT